MKSFKHYANSSVENSGNGGETLSAEELTKKIASAYNGRSSSDILQSILLEAEKSKRAGTLSNEEIEAFYQSFAPMLGAGQKRTLRAVVDRLKGIK